ncbi:MAG: flavin reductase [Victivallaceae bacterium]|jgi:flavin reductase (DIM6/NTAB) family NADH-FMN oxidoreductase RutF|nr:flavin reductase [Victivallaceae bacterium]NLK82532.1 flavin reductase family protein [Lentisphaerota bacterium]MDD3116478.1 flavin reductase [Victivallaceae bacterium]MDD3703887.1 flavin reductase [Victivallaceae bacterium]MDD4316928.1 flavin reductase [Victivallaceae bacterium]
MIDRITIPPEKFNSNLFSLFSKQWMLLTAGDLAANEINTMTVSWGFLGYLWQRPVVMVLVRPQRWTMKFIEKHDTFTLSAFPETHRDALNLCGSQSGRDINKIAAARLTPIESERIDAPGFAEAELIIECRKLYADWIEPKGFIDKSIINSIYPDADFHKIFIGGIENISGISEYLNR